MGLVSSSFSRQKRVSNLNKSSSKDSGASSHGDYPNSGNGFQCMCRKSFRAGSQKVVTEEPQRKWIFGEVLNPQSQFVQRWNRLLLLSRSLGIAVDPVFFYLLVINVDTLCLHLDGWFLLAVTILRSTSDIMLLGHIWLQLRLAYVSSESLAVGCGKLVWDARKIVQHYSKLSRIGFDAFVILPIPQVMFWFVVPHMIKSTGGGTSIMSTLLVVFLFQFIPKLIHLVWLAMRMQNVTGYVFGTAWWGFALNLLAYLTAAHVAGSCWYLLAIQRVEVCLHMQCHLTTGCDSSSLGCFSRIWFTTPPTPDPSSLPIIAQNASTFPTCMQSSGSNYPFGIYAWAVALTSTTNGIERIVYPIFWGVMTLSSFGNALVPSNHMLEALFCIIVIICGLLLFTMLIGNIQVFLHSITAKKEEMRFKFRDLEWWMKRRQLPNRLRHRVRLYERQKWAAMRGIDEDEMIRELPENLRHEIKRHLCLDLVRQVPFFDQMDEIVLDNLCDRVKPMLNIKGEMIIREGDPVLRMLFVLRGQITCEQRVNAHKTNIFILGPGNFWGDELLSWCLRRPFVDRLPQSSATLTCVDSAETFGLAAEDLRYVTEHLRYKFANEKLTRTIRHYSLQWRTWAAVTIQLAWRRFKAHRAAMRMPQDLRKLSKQRRVLPGSPSGLTTSKEDHLRLYTAMFTSPKPVDHY